MNLTKRTFCLALSIIAYSTIAQTFTEQTVSAFSALSEGKVIPLDYDNDADLDLIFIGTYAVHLYQNNGGAFTEVLSHNLPILVNPGFSLGDFNNDGYVDIVLSGRELVNNSFIPVSKVYLNSNGGGAFSLMPNANLIGLSYAAVDCADFDSDGDVDILMTGLDKRDKTRSVVYSNNNDGTFSETSLTMPGVRGSAQWGDYDKDGDLDVLISGEIYQGSNNTQSATKIYRNEGNQTFTEAVSQLSQIRGKSSWVDINGDGRLDVIVSGVRSFSNATELYVNGNNNSFTITPSTPFNNTQFNEFVLVDIDNDGDKDIVAIDFNSSVRIYLNASGGFTELTGSGLPNAQIVSVSDFETDGDFDLILMGFDSQTFNQYVKAFRNGIGTTNSSPSPPSGLAAETLSSLVTKLSWSASGDAESGSSGLLYNVRIGTNSGGENVMSPLSSTGGSLRAWHDNTLTGATSMNISNLPDGSYFASVQAVDQSNKASSFSPEIMFSVSGRPATPIAPNNLVLINLKTESVLIKWSDLSFNEDNFILERSIQDETNYAPLSTPAPNVTSFEDKTTDYNTKYYYRIKAMNSNGSSAYSISVSITTRAKGIFKRLADLTLPLTEMNTGLASAWVDFNNDNYLDPVIIGSLGTNKIYKTNSDGSFTRVVTGPLATDVIQSRTGAWADYDNDGDIDVFVPTSSVSRLYRNDGGGNFTDVTASPFTENSTHDSNGAAWADYDNDGFLDLVAVNYMAPPYLYHNNGNGTFTKVVSGDFASENGSYSMPTWCDVDNDGFIDLILIGNFSTSSLFKNINGELKKMNAGALTSVSVNGAGASWADFDGDGDFDAFVPNYTNQTDVFFVNNGNGIFNSVNNALTLGPVGTDDSAWGDYDNDGKIDIVKSGNESKALFKNNGGGIFEKMTNEVSLEDFPYGSVAWGDYNNDGFLDLLGSQYYNENLLLRNHGNSNHWLTLKLIGTATNRSAIGVRAKVKTTDVWQFDFVQSQSGGRSQNSLPLEFGLGSSSSVDSILISWPNRGHQSIASTGADQILTITEPAFPVAPTLISVSNTAQSNLLSWMDNSGNETGFLIERSLNDRIHFARVKLLPPNATSFEDDIVLDGDSVFFRVYAVNGSTLSWQSNVKGVFVPLRKPTDLVGEKIDLNLKISWTDNSSSETGYEVERAVDGPAPIFLFQNSAAANVNSYTDQQTAEATTYLYRVRAIKGTIKSVYSDTLSISTILKKPTDLQVTWNGTTSTLTWVDNSQKESKFIIEKSTTDNSHFEVIGEVNANVTSFFFQDVADFSTVFYRVKATTTGYESEYSNEVSVILTETDDPSEVSIFPNPAADFVVIKNLNSSVRRVSLISSTGSVAESLTVGCCNQLTIPVSHLAHGLYIVRLDDADGQSSFVRMLKLGR